MNASADLSTGRLQLLTGQKCLQDGHLQGAMQAFYRVVQTGEDVLQKPGATEEAILAWASMLVEAGKNLNMLQASSQAAQSFTTALRLSALVADEKGITCMAKALSSLVHTYLHLRDCSGAASVVAQYQALLETCNTGRIVLGNILLELGRGQLEQTLCSSATDTLRKAYQLVLEFDPDGSSSNVVKVLSALGYCYLCANDSSAADYLGEALQRWRARKWPPEEALTILNTMKHYLEAQFKNKEFEEDTIVCNEMLRLHNEMSKYVLGMQVADAFTYLGTVAFHKENEMKATQYFEQSLGLYKQAVSTEETREEIQKLLRFIGVACYNSRDFQKAARSYQECLHLLEHHYHPGNLSKLGQIAECCASLGFTYSRLRDFDNMLKYYERALELESRLAQEDLQLIETNIGSLYHVKAVKYEHSGESGQAKKYYQLAENAFNRALRYSWKSFPYINYGYYLLCRGQYDEAASILQQGYLNGVIDKDTVEFDHTEDPILLDDLRVELEGREDIRMPAVIIALYLKTLAQARMGNCVGAEHTANQLEGEVVGCRFTAYYIEGYGEQRMKALSYSLLGYAYRSLGWQNHSYKAFQSALGILPGYGAAQKNLRTQQSFNAAIKNHKVHAK